MNLIDNIHDKVSVICVYNLLVKHNSSSTQILDPDIYTKNLTVLVQRLL